MTKHYSLPSSTRVRDFALSRGWILDLAFTDRRLFALRHDRFAPRMLVFPIDDTAPDHRRALEIAPDTLAEVQGCSRAEVALGIAALDEDVLRIRFQIPNDPEGTLPLRFTSLVIAGAQKLLAAAACSVLRPQARHPRLNRAEAQAVLDAARFGHTAAGSFVLSIGCPVFAVDEPSSSEAGGASAPFVRRTTEALMNALRGIVRSIEIGTSASGTELITDDSMRHVSSNLCEALFSFSDPSLRNDVEFEISWSPQLSRCDSSQGTSRVRLPHDYFRHIEALGRRLQPSHEPLRSWFPATVEQLEGALLPEGRRAGDVVLALFASENEIIRARAYLEPDQYELADRAHMSGAGLVLVCGTLDPGRQPRRLRDIEKFQTVERSLGTHG
jgi:hypothetical protein